MDGCQAARRLRERGIGAHIVKAMRSFLEEFERSWRGR
jgi:hypothetical protein